MAKVYAIKKGRNPGIYDSWDEAKKQVDGFSGAEYKSFKSREDAETYMGIVKSVKKEIPKNVVLSSEKVNYSNNDDLVEIYVDGSFKDGEISYGIVFVKNNSIFFKDHDIVHDRLDEEESGSRNVAGEVWAMKKAIQIINVNGYKNVCFYYDYVGLEKWATGDWKAKAKISREYVEYFKKYMENVKYEFKHIKGHSGNEFNEEADRLAKTAREKYS